MDTICKPWDINCLLSPSA